MSALWRLSAADIAEKVRRGDVRAEDVVSHCLVRIRRVEPRIGAYLRLFEEQASERAEAIDRRRRQGSSLGPLAGVPVAIKDNLSLSGSPMTCGARILEGYVAPYTATAVQRLLDADAILLGATNLDAFAMGSSCEASAFGPTRNPWHLGRVPGGSSGGSAAAVAAGTVPLALGSDTGGSVRQPASFCGVLGLRPTYGRVSRHGLTAFASSMDQIGPLARSVEDVALALEVMAGDDPRDSTCLDRPFRRETSEGSEIRGWRLGVVTEIEDMPLDPSVRSSFAEASQRLRDLGCAVVEVSVPNLTAAVACYYVAASCEASTNLARFDGIRFGRRVEGRHLVDTYRRSRGEGLGIEVKRRIMLGTLALSSTDSTASYARARGVRQALRQQMLEALAQVDLLLTPTTPGGAFALGEHVEDPLAMVLSDRLTTPASLAGLPALSLPCGRDQDDLPLGLQIIGRPFEEAKVLQLGRALEDAIDWQVEPGFVEPIANRV